MPIAHQEVGILVAADCLDDTKIVGKVGILGQSGNIRECLELHVLLEDLLRVFAYVECWRVCEQGRHLNVILHRRCAQLLTRELKSELPVL